jgi:hypothetical protein
MAKVIACRFRGDSSLIDQLCDLEADVAPAYAALIAEISSARLTMISRPGRVGREADGPDDSHRDTFLEFDSIVQL